MVVVKVPILPYYYEYYDHDLTIPSGVPLTKMVVKNFYHLHNEEMIKSFFVAGWQTLIEFVKSSIVNGSKEVALAAINCLQTTILTHSVKVIICPQVFIYLLINILRHSENCICLNQGNLPMAYLKSVLDVYEHFLLESPSRRDKAIDRVKQEILHGLGNLCVLLF